MLLLKEVDKYCDDNKVSIEITHSPVLHRKSECSKSKTKKMEEDVHSILEGVASLLILMTKFDVITII